MSSIVLCLLTRRRGATGSPSWRVCRSAPTPSSHSETTSTEQSWFVGSFQHSYNGYCDVKMFYVLCFYQGSKNLESSHHSGTCLCCKIQLLCWTMCKSLLKFLELCICGLNPPVCYFSIFDIIIWTFCIFKFNQHIKYWYPFKMFWYQRLWVCLFCPWIIYIPVTFKIRGCLY